MRDLRHASVACLALAFALAAVADAHAQSDGATVSGPREQWHRIELRFAGPVHRASDELPNPFLDYRLQCRFEGPSGQVLEVPGFFDGDGAGGEKGDAWICRFAPDEVGSWSYRASFRSGPGVAVSLEPDAGLPAHFDGESGEFEVEPSTAGGRDFRAAPRGRLVNVGDHYMTFLGSGDRWLKGGLAVPENLLGYAGFANTPDAGHGFAAHVADWRPGDPDWDDGAGRGIIGLLNYVAGTGANGLTFQPMNVGGEAGDTFPTRSASDRTHYDVAKLRQWEVVLTHATSLGLFLHVQLADAASADAGDHDRGELGTERKLFYRELVARFGHHPGLEWDLGEANDYGDARRRAFAAHLKALDAYDHPVASHTPIDGDDAVYGPLLGNRDLDMTALQLSEVGLAGGDTIREWRRRSAEAGAAWVVSLDEPQGIENDPSDAERGHAHGRRAFLWPVYLSGGGGFAWHIQEDGGGDGFDRRVDDLRALDEPLRWTGHALAFMQALPFWLMEPRPELAASSLGGPVQVLARPGDSYALYHDRGGFLSLDLRNDDGAFEVIWFDPRTGDWLDGGTVEGGAWVGLGEPPFAGDAAALVRRTQPEGGDAAPVAAFTATPLAGEAPLTVRLDSSASFDDEGITARAWDLGDGAAAEGLAVSHTFTEPGSHVVELTVRDALGQEGRATRTIEVRAPTPGLDPGGYRLVRYAAADRTGAAPLDGARVDGDLYVAVLPEVDIVQARFHLDGSPTPVQVESIAPFDLVGGTLTTALPFDAAFLADGRHELEVELDLASGPTIRVAAAFTVGDVPLPPPPPGGSPPTSELLRVSAAADRSGASLLAGARLAGDVRIFLEPAAMATAAVFFLDDTQLRGVPLRLDDRPPFDLVDGDAAVARAFDTRELADGEHTLSVALLRADGRIVISHETFSVANDSAE